jgi:hypothetical protein
MAKNHGQPTPRYVEIGLLVPSPCSQPLFSALVLSHVYRDLVNPVLDSTSIGLLARPIRDELLARLVSPAFDLGPSNRAPPISPLPIHSRHDVKRLLLFVSRAEKVHVQPHRPRHTRRQLPEKCVSRIDINPLAVLRPQQPALLRVFPRIVT